MFRDRDLFVHDGSKLRRFRLSAPVQAVFFVAPDGARRLVRLRHRALRDRRPASRCRLADATEARARQIEQRQALIEAIVTGQEIDDATLAAAAAGGRRPPTARWPASSKHQLEQAALIAQALDARYQTTAAELKKLGISPARVGRRSAARSKRSARPTRPSSSCSRAGRSSTHLQDGAIAVPSDKPVKTARLHQRLRRSLRPVPRRAPRCTPASISPAPVGTPIYATADGIVTDAGWNSGGYGNLVKIDHGRGIETRYGHLSAMLGLRPASASRAAS